MSIGGRSKVATSTLRRRNPGSAPASVSQCLTESFTGASWPIGSDLAWDEGHQATSTPVGSSTPDTPVTGDGSNALKRTLHVVSDILTIQAMDDTQIPVGGHTWRLAFGNARTQADVASVDMTVSAVVEGGTTANVSGEWVLIARNTVNGSEDIGNTNLDAYIARFDDDYIDVEMGYVSSVFAPGTLVGGGIFIGDSTSSGFTHTFAPGDTISMTVRGTGSATTISCGVNGVEYVSLDQADLSAALFSGDSLSDLPYGQRAGRGLVARRIGASWNHGTMDDVISMDSWEVCSA